MLGLSDELVYCSDGIKGLFITPSAYNLFIRAGAGCFSLIVSHA